MRVGGDAAGRRLRERRLDGRAGRGAAGWRRHWDAGWACVCEGEGGGRARGKSASGRFFLGGKTLVSIGLAQPPKPFFEGACTVTDAWRHCGRNTTLEAVTSAGCARDGGRAGRGVALGPPPKHRQAATPAVCVCVCVRPAGPGRERERRHTHNPHSAELPSHHGRSTPVHRAPRRRRRTRSHVHWGRPAAAGRAGRHGRGRGSPGEREEGGMVSLLQGIGAGS